MKYLIGVDGGNTKTDYLLYDIKGNFIDGIRSETCSHEAKGLGFEGAYRVMKENIDELLNRNNLTVHDVSSACFGLAGVDVPYQKKALEEVVERIGFTNYIVLNDGFLGIKAASPNGVGVCSINGTGTVNVGIDNTGKYFQVGGIGYLAGDEAGGSFLARRTIQAAFNSCFRSGQQTKLVDDVFKMYGITSKYEFSDAVILGKIESTYLIKALCKRANEGDEVAIEILETAGQNMALSIVGVIKELEFSEPIYVIQAGSVWAKATSDKMNNKFKEVVEKLTNKKCEYIILKEPPVLGAIIWAYELANHKLPSDNVRKMMCDSINKYQESL